ncbi:unnamed protein product [Linum trigynum]|uniref:Pre-rRNA-processing protein RIX1 N-terminal domain-containing protein n=1 Tax=Linum trigynum TaxID=586398 RepID=A0AAV2D3J5_9ROSI
MAAFKLLSGMDDVALKPRLLLTLMNEDLPDENRPLEPSKLSRVVPMIRTHKLLSERSLGTMSPEGIEQWESAVDDWVDRLRSLVASVHMPEKCWAGICLVGVTIEECSSERLAISWEAWFDQLVSIMQRSGNSPSLKVASCASISHLLTRLSGSPEWKRDCSARARKLAELLLKMLNEDNPHTLQESAVHLLCTIITTFPASLCGYSDIVEKAITSKLISGNDSPDLQKKLAHALALLPNINRGKDRWLSILKNILWLLNGSLTDAFRGMEEKSKGDAATKFLGGKPGMIWNQKLEENVLGAEKRMAKLHTAMLLMSSCLTMLANSYHVQVKLPVRSLLALAERVVMVHGSLPDAKLLAAEQECVCSELPALHSYALELLSSVIECLRSQLLPHAADIIQLVTKYSSRCQMPELRVKLYSIFQMLLIYGGAGMTIYIGQMVVDNALVDLNVIAAHANENKSAVNSVKKAALEAIKALLTVGGALGSQPWRSSIDNLVMNMASKSCTDRWRNERSVSSKDHLSMDSDIQFAVLEALLASLLSSTHTRPLHLGQSLELFNRGRREAGLKISEFCTHALLALEVLIHPRALPLIDPLSMNPSTPFSRCNDHEPALDGSHPDPTTSDILIQRWRLDTMETEETVCETTRVDHPSGQNTSTGNTEVEMTDETPMMMHHAQPNNETTQPQPQPQEPGFLEEIDMEEEEEEEEEETASETGRIVHQSGHNPSEANAGADMNDEAAMMVDYDVDEGSERTEDFAESDNESTDSAPCIKRVPPDSKLLGNLTRRHLLVGAVGSKQKLK